MASKSHHREPGFLRTLAHGLIVLVLSLAVLYFGKPVLVPLALAILLTFVLTPLVMLVQRTGLGRVPAVLLVTVVALLVVGALGWALGAELSTLAKDIPRQEQMVRAKIERLRANSPAPVKRLLSMVSRTPAPAVPAESGREAVVVVPPGETSSALSRYASIAGAVLEPVASAGLVLILVIFMLMRREDLRNRIIGMLGHTRLTGTTRVLVESAQRVGRFLLMQLAINTGFGVLFGLGLLLIGVPYWLLWGALALVLRFVPYLGSWLAASLPLLVSVALGPGWGQPLLVLGWFLFLELVTANVAEPLLFGHSTGVSPLALMVAALFWTWVWGPVGLILSTPLTVCLVVLGQHVPRLGFLSQLLSDQPALAPYLAFYQRLLAGDRREAEAVAKTYATSQGWVRALDDVLLPALTLARRDRAQAGMTPEDEASVVDAISGIVQDLSPPVPAGEAERSPRALVLGCPAHHRAEELTLAMLAAALRPDGCRIETVTTREMPAEIEARIVSEHPDLVFVAVLPPGGVVQARYLCRRLRRKFADLKIVVGYWGRVRNFDKLLVSLRAAGASYVTTSIEQSRTQIVALLPAEPIQSLAAEDGPALQLSEEAP